MNRLSTSLGMCIVLWTSVVAGGGVECHELALEKVLPSGQDLVLIVATEPNLVRRHAVTIPGQPYTACRLLDHDLKLEGLRLSGAARVSAGKALENVRLDLALDKGGSYSVSRGMRTAEGNVRVDRKVDGSDAEWSVCFEGLMGLHSHLVLGVNADRAAKSFQVVSLRGYNKSAHEVGQTKLTFDGAKLAGELAFTVKCDGWLPPDKKDMPGSLRFEASLDGRSRAGVYSAVTGVAVEHTGRVAVAPGSLERLAELTGAVLPLETPWRAWLVLATGIEHADGKRLLSGGGPRAAYDEAKVRHSPAPPQDWHAPQFDDSHWPRYQSDLADQFGPIVVESGTLPPAQLYLRSLFGVADPSEVKDLVLKLEYLGGAVVYVNGREIGRGHMSEGNTLWAQAEEYPRDLYTTEDGKTPLPLVAGTAQPEAKWAARYRGRQRSLALPIPAEALKQGANTLGIVLHRAPFAGPMQGGGWSHVGFCKAVLCSVSGKGVIPYDEAIRGTRVWSAESFEQIANSPSPTRLGDGRGSNRCTPVRGVQQGNPFEPLRPVKMLVPRNGVCSGQVVVSDPDGLREVAATLGDLAGPGGARLPASAVQIRYARQHGLLHYCDSLEPAPPQGATTIPVWILVQAPKDAAAGWYAGSLDLRANGRQFAVPVRLLVSPVSVPDARDFTSSVSLAESPECVALEYGVKCWSDEHLKLLEPSLAMMGMVGNDVVHIPVILGRQASWAVSWVPGPKTNVSGPGPGRRVPLVRWVKKGEKLEPEFGLLEKFLDVYSRHCAPPQALCLYIWDASSAKEVADVYEGRKNPTRAMTPGSPLMVAVWDPATDKCVDTVVPAILDTGGEEFWKPLFEGVRAIVKRRGWSERCIVAGMGGDIRPSQRTGELLRQWAPYVRWNLLSHFSGDPGPKDGKMIATGGLEIAVKEWPAGGCLPFAEFERRVLHPADFLELPTYREHGDGMTPFMFRTMAMQWGAIGRLALDFWPGRGGPRSGSWFSHTERLTVPGPQGATPSVRFQMLREGVQDTEIRAGIIRAYGRLPEEQRTAYRELLAEFVTRPGWGSAYLSQMEMAYDWPAYVARVHEAAATLAGAKVEAKWDEPPR